MKKVYGNSLVCKVIKYVIHFKRELNISSLHGWTMLPQEDKLLNKISLPDMEYLFMSYSLVKEASEEAETTSTIATVLVACNN